MLTLVAGCSATRSDNPLDNLPATPPQWATPLEANDADESSWSTTLGPQLEPLVATALAQNPALAQQAARVQFAAERIGLSRADRLPTLGLNLSGQRNRFNNTLGSDGPTTNITPTLSASFDVDLWGRLSLAQKASRLAYAAEQARFEQQQRTLVQQVAFAFYDLLAAQQLLLVFEARLVTLQDSLDVIQRGYRAGLNEALDVYLANTTVAQERANIANQAQLVFNARTSLETLLGQMPEATVTSANQLPEPSEYFAPLQPGQVLLQHPTVNAAWLDLLSADATLANAQRNRLPGLSLSASTSDSAERFDDLLQGRLAWTAAASLFQPLFQGGRLRALSRQAAADVQRLEQRYLEQVFDTLAALQNTLSATVTLNERLQASQDAATQAQAALDLAFSQYQRGLVNYATVLESQRRAFDTQTGVIQLQNQQLRNRINVLVQSGLPLDTKLSQIPTAVNDQGLT